MKTIKKPRRKSPEEVIHLRGLSKQLKNDFKAACAHHGRSMTDVIVEMMKRFIGR